MDENVVSCDTVKRTDTAYWIIHISTCQREAYKAPNFGRKSLLWFIQLFCTFLTLLLSWRSQKHTTNDNFHYSQSSSNISSYSGQMSTDVRDSQFFNVLCIYTKLHHGQACLSNEATNQDYFKFQTPQTLHLHYFSETICCRSQQFCYFL